MGRPLPSDLFPSTRRQKICSNHLRIGGEYDTQKWYVMFCELLRLDYQYFIKTMQEKLCAAASLRLISILLILCSHKDPMKDSLKAL
jgi:hypothetical protein